MPETVVQPMSASTSAHADAVLACHRHQGESNDCGPFSAAMVIQALSGRSVDPDQLSETLLQPRPRGLFGLLPLPRRWPGSATFPWGMVDLLRSAGLKARWRLGMREDDLAALIEAGAIAIPVVGTWRPRPWAHYMVLLAHDPERGWGFADPVSPEAALSWLPNETFRKRWRAMGRLAVLCDAPRRDAV